jgi:hypothetical protein
MKRNTIPATIAAFVMVGASASYGQTVNHIAFPGLERQITDISGFMTTGEDMGGMRVTAYFDAALTAANSETFFWNPGLAGSQAGSVVGTGWRLHETGDTWNSIWRLSPAGAAAPNLNLYGLLLEGFLPSDTPVDVRATVFDRTEPFFGTDGSYRGHDLSIFAAAGDWSHVRVSYIDEVDSLADAAPGPVGDLYRTMRMQFGESIPNDPFPIFNPIPFDFNDQLAFFQDTDTVGERIPGDPGEEGMPEPASAAMLAIGLIMVGLRRSHNGPQVH